MDFQVYTCVCGGPRREDTFCNLKSVEYYVPVRLIVNALGHFLNTVCLILWCG